MSAERTNGFREAKRHLAGLTAQAEKRALLWLAPRTPPWVTSDHLTLLGLGAMAACGAPTRRAAGTPGCSLLVNLGLAVNWLGDSLDGTLARYRQRERPRFGFYVDHLVDAFGALLVLGGLALSGLMSPWSRRDSSWRTTCWRSRPTSRPTRSAGSRSRGVPSAARSSGSCWLSSTGSSSGGRGCPSARRLRLVFDLLGAGAPRRPWPSSPSGPESGDPRAGAAEGWAPALGANPPSHVLGGRPPRVEGEALSLV